MITIEQVGDGDGVKLYVSNFCNPQINDMGDPIAGTDVKFITINVPRKDIYNWVTCDENDKDKDAILTNQEGKPVKRTYKNSKGYKTWLNKYRVMEIIHRLSDKDKSIIFSQEEPVKYFCDIETEVIFGIPDVTKADEQIYCICIINSATKVIDLYSTTSMTDEQISRFNVDIAKYFDLPLVKIKKPYRVNYVKCESEVQMMQLIFYRKMVEINWLSGWNFLKFDWAFMVKRAERLGVEHRACVRTYNRDSNANDYDVMSIADKWDRQKKTIVKVPKHKAIIDYLMLYEKWDRSVKLKTNNNLDAVATELFKIGKHKYDGSLMDLYRRDPYTYHLYNMIDTILVDLIDEKLGTYKTMMALSNEGMVQINDSLYASYVIEMLSYGEYLNKGMVFTDSKRVDSEESYEGGWVFPVKPGIFSLTAIFDFESLFPCLMAAFNTGTDTFLGKCNVDEDMIIVDGKKTLSTFTDKNGNKCKYDKEIHIYTAYGSVYSKETDSIMRLTVNKILSKRLLAKNGVADVEKEIAYLKKLSETT